MYLGEWADPPDCRPHWMQSPHWMPTPLDADPPYIRNPLNADHPPLDADPLDAAHPLDADPPRCTPP